MWTKSEGKKKQNKTKQKKNNKKTPAMPHWSQLALHLAGFEFGCTTSCRKKAKHCVCVCFPRRLCYQHPKEECEKFSPYPFSIILHYQCHLLCKRDKVKPIQKEKYRESREKRRRGNAKQTDSILARLLESLLVAKKASWCHEFSPCWGLKSVRGENEKAVEYAERGGASSRISSMRFNEVHTFKV